MTPSTSKWATPPQVAAQLGVDVNKILGFIRSGELVASNLAEKLGGRPRYKIDPAELADFLRRRQVQPKEEKQRRRRRVRLKSVPQYV